MAVVVAVTGKWDGRELAAAQKQLEGLKRSATASAGGMVGGFNRAGTAMKSMGSRMSEVGKTATYGMTLPIVGGLALATKGWLDHTKVTAQSAAVVKSTGGAANVTASQMEQLADKLERVSTIDGDVIQSGENMLATFTNIRNEAGKGNDVYTRATKTMLDMSVALGQDTKSSAMQLGKALNDPIKGLTALQRVGVSFTEQQKKQITTLTENGKTQEAQKIILAELNKEFGGSAKAAGKAAGPMGKLMVKMRQIGDSIGQILLPMVQKASEWLQKLANWFTGLSNGQQRVVVTLALLAAAFGPVLLVTGKLISAGGQVLLVTSKVIAALTSERAQFILMKTYTLAYAAASKVAAAGQWLVNAALSANPIGLVIAAIVALVAIFVVLWKKNETFRRIVTATWEAIKTAAKAVWGFLKGYFQTMFAVYKAIFQKAFSVIKAVVTTVFNFLKGYFKTVFTVYKTIFVTAWNVIKTVVSTVFGKVKDVVQTVLQNVKGVIQTVMGTIKGVWRTVWGGFKDIVTNVWDGIVSGIKGSVNLIIDAINILISGMNKLEFSAPDWVPVIGGKSWGVDIPLIPRLAEGGIVKKTMGGTVAVVGEGRYDEAVIPLTPEMRRYGLGGSRTTNSLTVNVDARGATDPERIREAAKRGAEEAFAMFARELRAKTA